MIVLQDLESASLTITSSGVGALSWYVTVDLPALGYSIIPLIVASRVEIVAPRRYLKPHLDIIIEGKEKS